MYAYTYICIKGRNIISLLPLHYVIVYFRTTFDLAQLFSGAVLLFAFVVLLRFEPEVGPLGIRADAG